MKRQDASHIQQMKASVTTRTPSIAYNIQTMYTIQSEDQTCSPRHILQSINNVYNPERGPTLSPKLKGDCFIIAH